VHFNRFRRAQEWAPEIRHASGITGPDLIFEDCYRKFAEHARAPREAPAQAKPVAARSFYIVPRSLDLDAKAVEFDLTVPLFADWHRSGVPWMAGLDELE
jgi:hypothetical protein